MSICLLVPLTVLVVVFVRSMLKKDGHSLAATNKWCDTGLAVLDYLCEHPGAWWEDPHLRLLIKLEAEAYEEFLATHPYCRSNQALRHAEWYRNIYEWRPPVLPTPKFV